MQVGHNVLNNYEMHLQDNVKMDNTRAADQTGQVSSGTDLSALKEGMVFKGQIMDIAGEKVQIALDNKAMLFARLQEGVELGVGDRLLFSVKENVNNQILIKPMFDSLYSAQTQVLEKALEMTGLSPTEKNFAVAKELMEAGMPLDKGSMVKLLSQSMKFPETPIQTLVSLNKMNIPVTAENIAQFERYQGYHHQLTGDIGQAAEGMAAFTESFPAGTPAATLLSVAGDIFDMFMPETTGEPADLNGNPEIAGENEAAGKGENGAAVQGENGATVQGENGTALEQTGRLAANGQIISGQEGALTGEGVSADKESAAVHNGENESVAGQESAGEKGSLSSLAEKTGLSREETANLARTLQKAGIPAEQVREIYKQSDNGGELMRNMLSALSESGAGEQAVRSIMESAEFKKLFTDMIKKNWALNPGEMKDPKEIDELYNKIARQSKGFEDAIAAKGGDTKGFNQNFQNMRQNMQFMEQLNNQMIYAQMPLKLSGQNANSELYIYADKRKLAEKKDGISVMLHLDMDHLGQTDIKVTLTGTNVNARFYLNDQQSVDIVAENMTQLAKQLADRGFSLTNEVIKRQPQESINKVVDEIIDENAERSIKRYTFDARM